MVFSFFLFYLPNASRDRKNETGAGVAQAKPVTAVIFRVYAIVLPLQFIIITRSTGESTDYPMPLFVCIQLHILET